MDLRYCPSCKQSVLDDDAEECPFCGASMSGKPGSSKPKAPAAKAGKPTARKAGAKKAEGKPAKPKKKAEESDDPFDVDQTAAMKAIQAGPKPGKGRTHKIQCPMCETVGFVPRKAVGHDVRCANKDCLVPVFKLERKKKTEATQRAAVQQQIEQSSSKPPLLLYGGIAAVVVLAGLGALFMLKDSSKPADLDTPFGGYTKKSNDNGGDTTTTKNGTTAAVETPENAAPTVDYNGIIDKLLADMIDVARRSNQNRDKPLCRRLTADSQALFGNFDKAKIELAQLMSIDPRKGYYRIQPLTRMAFGKMSAGDSAGGSQAIDEALKAAEILPNYGRTSIDLSTMLAASLVVAGRDAEAESILSNKSRNTNEAEILLSSHITLEREFAAAGFSKSAGINVDAWTDPQRTAVAGIVMLHSQPKLAVDWISKQPKDVGADSLALCAEIAGLQLKEHGDSSSMDQLIQLVSDPFLAATVKAVAARSLAESPTTTEKAKALFPEAETFFAGIQPFPEATTPRGAAILNYQLPDPGPIRAATILGTELACAASKLGNGKGENILKRTVSFPPGMAPATGDAEAKLQEAQDTALVKARLKRQRNYTADQLRAAVRNYRSQWTNVANASRRRQALLASIVRRTANSGLYEAGWNLLGTINPKDNLEKTEAAWHIVDGFAEAGDTAKRDAVISKLGRMSSLASMTRNLGDMLRKGNSRPAVDLVKKVNAKPTDVAGAVISTVLEETKEGQMESVLEFLKRLPPKFGPLREETLDLVSSRAAHFSSPDELRKLIDSKKFTPTEIAAAYHGLAVGLARKATPPPTETGSVSDTTE